MINTVPLITLLLVPVSLRSVHPAFIGMEQSTAATQGAIQPVTPAPFPLPPVQPAMPQRSRSGPAPAPFPVSGELGERHTLPVLLDATKAEFDKALAALKELTGAQYIPPPVPAPAPPLARNTADIINIDDVEPTPPPPSRPPTLYPTLVFIYFKAQGRASDMALVVDVPYRPFVAQIIARLWVDERVKVHTGKWNTARIWVAVSRSLLPFHNPTYDSGLSGFNQLGLFSNVFGDFMSDGIGGNADQVFPEVIAAPDELDNLRRLYSVPAATNIFSIYFSHMVRNIRVCPTARRSLVPLLQDADSHAASVVADPGPASSSFGFTVAPPTTSISPAPGAHANESVTQILLNRFPELTALYRALYEDTHTCLGGAYKKHAGVRVIRQMAQHVGMVWPETGLPKPLTIGLTTFAIEDMLALSPNSPALGTFRNHNTDHTLCAQALANLKRRATDLPSAENDVGTLLFCLVEAEILNPSTPDFRVSPESYHYTSKAISLSGAAVKTQVSLILEGNQPTL
ncbi:hypothetical protein C8R46DRAFT_1222492 [Mycena filopes]|nr:hypothetical protein C8R46DRAFT_1222492 [Mycena filopes]